MNPRRGAVGGAVCLTATVLLVVGWNVQPASSVFHSAKCDAGTDGKEADKPCIVDAYLGSIITINCPDDYSEISPPKAFDPKAPTFCESKMPAAPDPCKGSTATLKQLFVGNVAVDKKTFATTFTRQSDFRSVKTAYARCAKTDNSAAMYFGIKFIPRPKFPETGIIVSCPVLEERDNKTCDLTTHLAGTAVFDCPVDTKLAIVPPQKGDKATICKTQLAKIDDTCTGDSLSDVSPEGVTALFLKQGKEVKAVAFKNPQKSNGSDITGWLMCKGETKAAYFKYTFKREMGSTPPMPKKYSVCDPADGVTFLAPCEINLKPQESVLLNCNGLMDHIPKKLAAPKDPVFCTELIAGGDAGTCADDKQKKWSDVGAKIFTNGNNLVVTFTTASALKKTTEAYGRCREGMGELHFKITFQQSATTTTTKEGGGAAYTNHQSITTAACLGVLGAIILVAGAV